MLWTSFQDFSQLYDIMHVFYDTALYLLECYSDRKQRGLRVQKADGLQKFMGPINRFCK